MMMKRCGNKSANCIQATDNNDYMCDLITYTIKHLRTNIGSILYWTVDNRLPSHRLCLDTITLIYLFVLIHMKDY